jgi:MFS family permease
MENNFKKYILLWFGGSVSQLGSSMTSFALILWTYTQTNSAMAVSLMSFCRFLPYCLVSFFAGGFIDRHSKKAIMLTADTIAAAGSLLVCFLWWFGRLEVTHIYIVNFIIGFMNSFQMPAQSVAVGILVPKDRLAQMSGLDSFSGNLVSVLSPVLASSLFAFGGLGAVMTFDLLSFLFNFIILAGFIKIPENLKTSGNKRHILSGTADGFSFLFRSKSLWYLIISMAVINFFSRLTYENILSPMILARSNNNSMVLGTVNTVLGIGGILSGIFVSTGKIRINSVKFIYYSCAASFLLGDMIMGLGQNMFWWSAAALGASLPISFIAAGQNMILYRNIPRQLQGSVFSIRNAIQHSTIPIGILLGGYLADYVFEPFMKSGSPFAKVLGHMTGTGNGSGMAVMFLCTSVLGCVFSLVVCQKREIREIDMK